MSNRPQGKITDAELIALSVRRRRWVSRPIVSSAVWSARSSRWFPHLPEQSQCNRRLRRPAPWIVSVHLQISEFVALGKLRVAEGTLVGVANYPGCASRSEFAGHCRLRLLRRQEPVRVGAYAETRAVQGVTIV